MRYNRTIFGRNALFNEEDRVMATAKKATSIRLTVEAKRLLGRLAKHLGISQSATFELLIRERAKQEGWR